MSCDCPARFGCDGRSCPTRRYLQSEFAIARADYASRVILHIAGDFGQPPLCGCPEAEQLVSVAAYTKLPQSMLCECCLELVRGDKLGST